MTNAIAFSQESFTANGNYNYVYSAIQGSIGLATASFNAGTLMNIVVGSCAGASCAIISGEYSGGVGMPGNQMLGFSYYSVNGANNYNLVGNSQMNIFMDSYAGIYY